MLSSFPPARRHLVALLAGVLTLLALPPAAPAQQGQRLPAPELDGGTGWLGVDKPIRLRDLRGKIVVFDFWTLC
jgi:hypothetical protein